MHPSQHFPVRRIISLFVLMMFQYKPLFLYAIFMMFASGIAVADDTCRVFIDLKHIKNDRVHVIIRPPDGLKDSAVYFIPTIIPGTYYKVNYGRFYHHFKAQAQDGSELRIKRSGKNEVVIFNSSGMYQFEYDVHDSFDDLKLWDNMLGCGGSNFTKGVNYVINHQLFYGYFKGFLNAPFSLEIQHPHALYGSAGMKMRHGIQTDKMASPDYFHLADNPILYCRPDTSSVQIGPCVFSFSVYSPNSKITSDEIKRALIPALNALKHFFGEFPVRHYTFLFFFHSRTGILKYFGNGALEHNHSSFYYLPEPEKGTDIGSFLNSIVTHEFLHLLTPLNVHSQEIDQFDFHTPKMSAQQWMYEGITDYFTLKTLAADSLISTARFMRALLMAARYDQKMPVYSLTESGRNIIVNHLSELPFKLRQLNNYYERGKLAAFYIDLTLLNLSDGAVSLKQVMMKLMRKYHSGHPFSDTRILDEISGMTYPEIGEIFRKYIIGSYRLPYAEIFSLAGYEWIPGGCRVLSFGRIPLDYDREENTYCVSKTTANNFGLKKGDMIELIDHEKIDSDNVMELYVSKLFIPKKQTVSVVITRHGKEMELSALPDKTKKLKTSWIIPYKEAGNKRKTILKWCIEGR